jgi:ubiquinone/menaquinone biosynthesis C-methylase UbiE
MTRWRSLSSRSLEREIMDDHSPPQPIVDEVYAFLGAINRWLVGGRATLRRFEAFSARWQPGERVHVLDVACGGGDLARDLIAWGRRRGFQVQVTALDLSPRRWRAQDVAVATNGCDSSVAMCTRRRTATARSTT